MKLKYKNIKLVVFALLLMGAVFAGSASTPVSAAGCTAQALANCTQQECAGAGGEWGYQGSTQTCHAANADSAPTVTPNPSSPSGGESNTGLASSATSPEDPAGGGGNCKQLSSCDLISKYLNPAIQLFSVLVGIVVAISIVVGGVQYASSAGDPQAAAAARRRIRNAIIGLLAYFFLYALINFLVPGGIK